MSAAERFAARLDALEADFGRVDPTVIRDGVVALLAEAGDDVGAELRARALSDLGVIAHALGAPPEAAARFEQALELAPSFVPALEGLAALLAGAGDTLQAVALWRAAARAEPDEPALWTSLATAAAGAGLWPAAREAAARALELTPADEVARRVAAQAAGALPERTSSGRRLLIAVDRFFPSSGGSERLAEDAAIALRGRGWRVEVVTRALPERERPEHRGLPIHELHPARAQHDLAAIVAGGSYDAILSFAAPASWPILGPLALPHPRPHVVVVPCVNGEGDAALRADRGGLRRYAALLAGAGAVGHSSLHGLDRRLCADLGIASNYVPNAVNADAPDVGAPARVGLAPGERFLLVVGNHWPEKDHLGLLAHLREHDDDVRMVMVGGPSAEFPDLAVRIAEAATRDPRVILAGPRTREEVSGLMEAASLLLLPSKVEATPLVVLEAMSHGLPWIATPSAGAVHDHAGGLIVPLDGFLPTARALLAHEPHRAALGAAGHEHWAASYSWEQVGARYDALLSGARELPPLRPPAEAVAATTAVRADVLAPAPAPATPAAAAA